MNKTSREIVAVYKCSVCKHRMEKILRTKEVFKRIRCDKCGAVAYREKVQGG